MLSIRKEPILTLIIEIKVCKVSEENFYCFFLLLPTILKGKKIDENLYFVHFSIFFYYPYYY